MDTVKTTAIIVRSDDQRRSGRVVTDPCEGYPAPAGMFLVNTGSDADPWFSFGMLTGRTRMRWAMACPTIVRFEVDTVAIDGVIYGVPGRRIAGTWLTRPENVVAA